MPIVKPLIYQDGLYRVAKDTDLLKGDSIAKRSESIAKNINNNINTPNIGVQGNTTFIYQIFKKDRLSSGSWYDNMYAHRFNSPSGNWSGWTKATPLIIPYTCRIYKIFINFSRAQFNWGQNVNLYLDIGFLDHNYNNTHNERILRFTISDTFSGSDTYQQGFRYTTLENNTQNLVGDNIFYEGELIGMLARTSDPNIPGRINTIYDPFFSIVFKPIL